MSPQRLKTGIPAKNTTEAAANTILTKTFRTKEKIKKKTRGLWDTARQLKGLSDLLASPLNEPVNLPDQPGPFVEPTTAPADNLLEIKTEVTTGSATDRSQTKPTINAVKPSVKKATKAAKEVSKKIGKQPKVKTGPNITLRADKVEVDATTNPAAAIPDISARELLKELKDIEKLIRERPLESAPKAETRKG